MVCNGIARQAVIKQQHRFPSRRIDIHRQFRECGLHGHPFDRGLNV